MTSFAWVGFAPDGSSRDSLVSSSLYYQADGLPVAFAGANFFPDKDEVCARQFAWHKEDLE